MKTDTFTTGQISKLSGVGIETIRFYERKGLIKEPPRRPSGYRQYPPSTIQQLQFIRRAKELGFSLQEIKELLALRITNRTCSSVRKKVIKKVEQVGDKIRQLQRIRRVLNKLITACNKKKSLGECPILEVLEKKEGRNAY